MVNVNQVVQVIMRRFTAGAEGPKFDHCGGHEWAVLSSLILERKNCPDFPDFQRYIKSDTTYNLN